MAQAAQRASVADADVFDGDLGLSPEEVEDRPSGDFIDGFLAGVAAVNAGLDPNPDARYFYSFDWIGDGEEEREDSLYAAFQVERAGLRFEITPVRDWRDEVEALGERWLGRTLPKGAAPALVDELVEVLDAFFAEDAVEAYRVEASGPDGSARGRSPIGAESDHLLFESALGRLLLEFSLDA
ncbi:MAG: hypothetical protein AAFW46_02015 [Pseudomonadota bacterium]